jgi:hypothetical protein
LRPERSHKEGVRFDNKVSGVIPFLKPETWNLTPDTYSHRRAIIGATLVALRAGIQHANKETNINSAATTPYVHESPGLTPICR